MLQAEKNPRKAKRLAADIVLPQTVPVQMFMADAMHEIARGLLWVRRCTETVVRDRATQPKGAAAWVRPLADDVRGDREPADPGRLGRLQHDERRGAGPAADGSGGGRAPNVGGRWRGVGRMQTTFNHRFVPFLELSSPQPLTYAQYHESVDTAIEVCTLDRGMRPTPICAKHTNTRNVLGTGPHPHAPNT